MNFLSKLTNNIRSCFDKNSKTSNEIAEPLSKSEKEIILSTYNTILKTEPEFFSKSWIMSASRSTSIRQSFNLSDPNSIHLEVEFTKFSAVIERFFTRIICDEKLEAESFENSCRNLGKRHVDFVSLGFHSNYWDIFLNCMIDVIAETVVIAYRDEKEQRQVQKTWNKFVGRIVYLMQSGFKERQVAEKNSDNKKSNF
uniref:GLOBIN domain-containing protein n=1 Tax=Parastrongyloides trichosuri TaxID=131310 RepID=A0A0N4ZJB2_PARTI